jgi:hypothetical protein
MDETTVAYLKYYPRNILKKTEKNYEKYVRILVRTI